MTAASPRDAWIEVGGAAEIPRRGARVVTTPRGRVAVFRTQGDRYFALDDRCPHRGGPLSEGIVHGAVVTCPLHGWVIDLESGRAMGADEGCAATLPVKVEAGRVFLGLGGPEGSQAA